MTGDAVDEADADQQQHGAEQVEREVLEGGVELIDAAADGEQAHRADQHQFEPDIEVEQVGGAERAADAGQQAMHKRQQQRVLGAGVRVTGQEQQRRRAHHAR
jgi:hypothetical protein